MIYQNDPLWLLSLLHRFSAFFPSKTQGRLKILLCFPARIARGGLFYSDFSVNFIPHEFNRITICWLCLPRHQLMDMLFLFTFNVPLAVFTSMLWVIILHEFKSLSHKSHSRWDCMILQYAVIAGLIQFALHLVQIPDFAVGKCPTPHNRASSMFYGWCDTVGCCSFTNSLLHIDPPISLKDFELWYVSPKDFIPLLYCSVFVHLWHCFTSSTVVSWQQFCHIGQLHKVFFSLWMLTHFFQDIGSVVKWDLGQSIFCHASWWFWWNCLLLLFFLLVYQP